MWGAWQRKAVCSGDGQSSARSGTALVLDNRPPAEENGKELTLHTGWELPGNRSLGTLLRGFGAVSCF